MNRLLLAALVLSSCQQLHAPIERSLIPKAARELSSRQLDGAERKMLAQQGVPVISDGVFSSFHVGYTALFHDGRFDPSRVALLVRRHLDAARIRGAPARVADAARRAA